MGRRRTRRPGRDHAALILQSVHRELALAERRRDDAKAGLERLLTILADADGPDADRRIAEMRAIVDDRERAVADARIAAGLHREMAL